MLAAKLPLLRTRFAAQRSILADPDDRAAFNSTPPEHAAGGSHWRALTQALALTRLTKYFLRAALAGSLSPDGNAQSRAIASGM
jgi:hypothetical protein